MIAAAGSGKRLGAGGPKAFVELAGRPLLEHSIAAIAGSGAIDQLLIAAPPGFEAEAEAALARAGAGLEGRALAGGATRGESVHLALLLTGTELVVVHDAARPLAGAELFSAVIERLRVDPTLDAAIAATPIVDTVKRAAKPRGSEPPEGAMVTATLDRRELWAAQTPQAFRADALRSAQKRAGADLGAATDEAALIEAAGGSVAIITAPAGNLKITTQADLALAAALLAASGRV